MEATSEELVVNKYEETTLTSVPQVFRGLKNRGNVHLGLSVRKMTTGVRRYLIPIKGCQPLTNGSEEPLGSAS